jgi:hypothetical protein
MWRVGSIGMKYSKVLTIAVALGLLVSPFVWAQAGGSGSRGYTDQSWSSSSQQSDPTGTVNPTRTKESHKEGGGRTVDKQSVERLMDGSYQPYLDSEQESVRVNDTTVRTIHRTYGRSPDGQKVLTQVTEEETRTLPGGTQKVVRTTSNPDANGGLQVVQREVQESKQTSSAVRETNTTVLTPDLNGGFTPSLRTQSRETKTNDRTVQFKTSTLAPDGNGNWQLNEVREGVIKDDGAQGKTKEERVLRPGSDGNLAVTNRTVTREAQNATGEKRQTVESYSADLPGTSPDGLQLNQRVTTVQRRTAGGGETTEERVDQRNAASPGDNLRTTQRAIDIVRPASGNTNNETRTVQTLGASGDLGTVWVDTRKIQNSAPAVQVDTKKPATQSPVKVDTGASSKPK